MEILRVVKIEIDVSGKYKYGALICRLTKRDEALCWEGHVKSGNGSFGSAHYKNFSNLGTILAVASERLSKEFDIPILEKIKYVNEKNYDDNRWEVYIEFEEGDLE